MAMRRFLLLCAGAAPMCALLSFVSRDAHAESMPIARAPHDDGDRAREDWLADLDFRGAVRGGPGYSTLFHSPVTSMSFEDEFSLFRLGRAGRFHIVFGMDGYAPGTPFEKDPARRSFLSATLGAGVNVRLGGPLLVVNATTGPAWSGDADVLPDALGLGARIALFPFYRPMKEDIECNGGWARTYVLSGLSAWGEAREDFLGKNSGSMLAGGIGFDLGRNVLLPILHQVLVGHCGV
jgi:hypothetical protein